MSTLKKRIKTIGPDGGGLHIASFLKALRRSDVFNPKSKSRWFDKKFLDMRVRDIEGFEDNSKITIVFDYPFDKEHQLTLTVWRSTSVARLIQHICHHYGKLYKTPSKSGVWGHYLNDLYLEGIEFKSDGTIELEVGS